MVDESDEDIDTSVYKQKRERRPSRALSVEPPVRKVTKTSKVPTMLFVEEMKSKV